MNDETCKPCKGTGGKYIGEGTTASFIPCDGPGHAPATARARIASLASERDRYRAALEAVEKLDPRSVHEAMMNAPHNDGDYRMARAALGLVGVVIRRALSTLTDKGTRG